MGLVFFVFQVVVWTLGLATAITGLFLGYMAFKRHHRQLVKPSIYLLLVSVPFLGVAVATVVDGLRPTTLSLGGSAIGLGILGIVAGIQYPALRRVQRYSVVLLIIGLVGAFWAVSSSPYSSTGISRPGDLTERAVTTRVVDGDTIIVLLNGRERSLRYIGMDTPETVHPSKAVECFGKEASEFNRRLVDGKSVWLERDVSSTDPYGRLLRYVWLDDEMVNAVLVREGYAQVATFPPDVKYQDKLLELQRLAKDENKGLWAACGA